MKMFELASRMKLRFETAKGLLPVEDLWDLPLQSARGISLDAIAIALNRRIKDESAESFVSQPTKADEALQLQFEIVKHIITVRLDENKTALEAAKKREQKEKLMEIIERKRNARLEETPLEDLEAVLAGLG